MRVHNLSGWDAAVLDAKRLVARAQKCCAYQFGDGFDDYTSPATLYESVTGTPVISSSYARFSPPSGLPGQGIRFPANSWVRKNLQSNQTTIIVKCAFYFENVGGIVGDGDAIFLAAWYNGTIQWSLVAYPSGVIALASLGIQVSTGPGLFSSGVWFNLELQVTGGAGTGTALLYINGFEVINATGLNTANGSTVVNQVSIGDQQNRTGAMRCDDFRVWDNTGTTQNAALGTDSRIITKLPSSAGASTQLTPNGAAANWQCVDDNPPDGDTTYVSGASSGLVDAYGMPSAGLTAAPAMTVARAYARKDDGATRTFELGVESSGSYGYGGTETLASSYAYFDSCIPNDPHTGSPPTAAAADAFQFATQETA
jgi:hypothetical protein